MAAMTTRPDLAVLRTCRYQHEADFIRSVLEGSGLCATTTGDDCGALDPALGMVRGIRVLVEAGQRQRAEEILASIDDDAESADTSDRSSPPFALTKWYMDCVDADGRTAIAYSTTLTWRGLSVNWHSLATAEPGTPPMERTTTGSIAAPAIENGDITWDAGSLESRFTCQSRTAPIARRLLDNSDGTIDWCCESSCANVTVERAGHKPIRGRGYVECLTMTLPPWRLPIETLRWGRWIGDAVDRSVVWIDWRGPHPLTAVFANGHPQANAVVADAGLTLDGATLSFGRAETLYARSLGDALGVLRPVLAPLLPSAWFALEDRKQMCRATLQSGERDAVEGWAILETVNWPL
jgi:hypothetical protein